MMELIKLKNLIDISLYFLYIDLTKVINSILKKLRDDGKIRIADKRITWTIRQAITKAIVDKSKKSSFD